MYFNFLLVFYYTYIPMSSVVVIYLEPIYDSYEKTYKKILTLGQMPTMPLAQYVRKISTPSLSAVNRMINPGSRCIYAILKSLDGDDGGNYRPNEYLEAEDIPRLISYLITNGYNIESGWTNALQKSKVDMSDSSSGGRRTLLFVCRQPALA